MARKKTSKKVGASDPAIGPDQDPGQPVKRTPPGIISVLDGRNPTDYHASKRDEEYSE